MSWDKKQLALFTLSGGVSTSIMWGIYLLLNLFLQFQVAYLIAYVLTIVVSYFLNALFVFKTPLSLRTFFQFPIIYLVQYVCSAILLGILVRVGFAESYSPIIALVLLLPLTFWLSRIIMVKDVKNVPKT